MSNYGPCQVCGRYVSVGPYEELLCRNCSEEDESYRPEENLYKLINEIGKDEAEGTNVRHRDFGEGVVTIASHEATVEFENRKVNIASDCLEVLE